MFHISVIILNNVQFTLRKKVLYDVSFLRKSIQFDLKFIKCRRCIDPIRNNFNSPIKL